MCLITFFSTQHLLYAEELLNENNLSVKVITVNHNIDTNCNKAIQFDCRLRLAIEHILENKVIIERFHNLIQDRLTLTDKLLKQSGPL